MPDTKVIVICNNKGGVGKTTCVSAIADILARKLKKSTLLIDADPQGNLSGRFGFNPENTPVNNSFDVLLQNELDLACHIKGSEKIPFSFFCNTCKRYSTKTNIRNDYENLKIICSSGDLEHVIMNYTARPQESDGIVRHLMQEIRAAHEFDYVLIDTQPNLSYLLNQIFLGSDYVIVPVEPTEDAFSGAKAIGNVFNNAAQKKSEFKTDDNIDFLGVFFNKWKKGTMSSNKFEREMENIWGNNPVFATRVPWNQDAENAANKAAPVTIARPSSPSAKAFESLAREMVDKIG